MARRIVFTSGKGGVGKTTLVSGIGISLARLGKKVLLVDTDLGLNNIDVVLGIERLISFDITDVVEGRCRAIQAVIRHPKHSNLHILTGAHFKPEKYVSPQMLKGVIEELDGLFDYILVDCPAGIEGGFFRAIGVAKEGVIVTTPHVSALRDADKVIAVLSSRKLTRVSLVVNMARADRIRSGDSLTPQDISALLKIPLLGVIPEEDDAYLCQFNDKNRAFRLTAERLDGREVKCFKVENTGFLERLKGVFGR